MKHSEDIPGEVDRAFDQDWPEPSPRPELLEAIDRYAKLKIRTGSFLQAVLENNLREAFARADEGNRAAMFEIVKYCHNNIPADCWGSEAKVAAWLEGR